MEEKQLKKKKIDHIKTGGSEKRGIRKEEKTAPT